MLHLPIAATTQTPSVGDPQSEGGRGARLANRSPGSSLPQTGKSLPPFQIDAARDGSPRSVGDVRSESASQAEGAGASNLLNRLPTWADTNEGRALLAAIELEQPMKKIADAGNYYDPQYTGRNAAALRAIFDRAYGDLINWVDEARVPTLPGRPMKPADAERYHQRREAAIAWARVSGADALIGRIVGDRA